MTVESLPQMLYLLAYNPSRQQTTARLELGLTLRAAALAELLMVGRLRDDGGRPRAQGHAAFADPLLDEVYQEIASSRPRRWQYWVNRGSREAARKVRDRLAADGVLRLERGRVLGILPRTKVIITDERVMRDLAERVRVALTETVPASRVDARDAALVALAARAEFGTILPRKERRRYKRRIDQLAESTGPVAPALRRAISTRRAAASGT